MDYEITQEIQKYLSTNEKLIWVGQPKKGIVFRYTDVFLIPFSLVWCGFAIFWFTAVLTLGAPLFFAMFGIPFIVVGLYLVFGRFIVDAKQRANTIYGFTHERIIVCSGIFKKTVKSYPISSLSSYNFEEKSDGSGTINFGHKSPIANWVSSANSFKGINSTPSFDLIEDVRQVYAKLNAIQKE